MSTLAPDDSHQLLEAEKTIKDFFLKAQIPPDIEDAILHESSRIEQEHGHPLYWAVRSSAIGEDLAESSFAGQFATVLNVRTDQLLQTYKEVASSKYNASVLVYQRMKNIHDDDVAMCVGFMEMIDPLCSGVMYTQNPINPENEEMVINAVWGIGELLVEGVISADVYVLKRAPGFPLIREETAEKEICLSKVKGGGLEQLVMSRDKSASKCLTEVQLQKLAEMAMLIEEHLQGPQDIEWCFDQAGQLYMLQARPLKVCKKAERSSPAILVDAGIIADDTQPISPGVGWGNFNVMAAGDFLKARLKAESAQDSGKKLYTIGHLLGVSRLLDLAMEDETMVERCVERFEAHDYSLGILPPS